MAKTFVELNEQLNSLVGEIEEAIKKEITELRKFEEENSGRIGFSCNFITARINVNDIRVDEIYTGNHPWVTYVSDGYSHGFDLEDEYAKNHIENYKLKFQEQDEEYLEDERRKKDAQYQEYLRLKALYE